MEAALSFLILALTFYQSLGQTVTPATSIGGIRLQNSSSDGNVGRVEVLYNNTWGTICDTYWSTSDGKVACRMLGFSDVVCATTRNQFGSASSEVPIWMSRLRCRGTEKYLDNCLFYGWGPETHSCTSHTDDAGLVCRNESLLDIPEMQIENTTTRSIAISWTLSNETLNGTNRQRFVVEYNTSGITYPRKKYITVTSRQSRYYTNLDHLVRNMEYSISVRVEARFNVCSRSIYSNYYMKGSLSHPIKISTNNTVPSSQFGVRLISPITGLDFLGRVEVKYNGTWGTVCDSYFSLNSANVICNMLNYTQAACAPTNARMGRGSGKIWLNKVQCSAAEILDECSYSYWDSDRSSCSSNHFDDVGVICVPEPEEFLAAPQGFNVSRVAPTSVTFSWKQFSFPTYPPSRRLILRYSRSDSRYTSSRTISYTSTSYTLRGLVLGITVNATITAQGRFSNYGCNPYIYGAASDTQSITTVELPPSGPPQSFHISVVSCTAINAEWELPHYNERNGIVKGYKLMILPANGKEWTIDVPENITEYIIEDLIPSTRYVVSVLAYTVGDGPRSIHLTATTNPQDICHTNIINFFGINGNGIDKATLYTYSYRGVNIMCGSDLEGVKIDWFFSNGTRVGTADRDIHEGHFSNGTTVLQFGRVDLCDAGVYSCRANQSSTGRVEQKTFKVTVNRGPPTPERVTILKVTSTSATIAWTEFACTGGHNLQYFSVRAGYYGYSSFYPRLSYVYFNSIDARLMNYTIIDLTVNTNYHISVRAEGQDNTYSGYSRAVTITTLPPVPTPPRNVSVQLVTPDTILVTWTRPAVTSGRIVYYTVYATPFISMTVTPRIKRQAESIWTVAKNFSSSTTSGNVTLPQQGVEYHTQVSVTVFDSSSGINRESSLSALDPNANIFVPIEGLPFPSSVHISSASNVSLNVAWDLPDATGYTVTGYLVKYSAMVEGRSPHGNLILFTHEGSSTTTGNVNQMTVQPLIPQTSYLLKVAALTARGEGMEMRTNGLTNSAASELERFVFFHFRFGPVFSCSGFRKDIEGQEATVKEQILRSLNYMCNCGLTDVNIRNGSFSCGEKDHQIIYRAHILGTRNYSAIDLVDLFQSWVRSGKAYIRINSFRMQLDPTCPARLDTLDDPECGFVDITTPPTTANPSKEPIFGESTSISVAEIVGIFIGVIIAILLIVVLVMFGVGVYFWKFRSSSHLSKSTGEKKSREEDVTPFADLDEKKESGMYEEKFY